MVLSTLLGVALWLLVPGSTAYCHHSPSCQAVGGLLPTGLSWAPHLLGTPTPQMSRALSQAWPPQAPPLVVDLSRSCALHGSWQTQKRLGLC